MKSTAPRSINTPPAIRAARTSDCDAICKLRRQLRSEERPGYPVKPEELRALTERQLRAKHQVLLVAESRGRLVGVLRCALPSPSERTSFGPLVAMLTTAYVTPGARRRGVLKRLVRAAELWSQERGATVLRLRNLGDNTLANTAWQALGFDVQHVVRERLIEP